MEIPAVREVSSASKPSVELAPLWLVRFGAVSHRDREKAAPVSEIVTAALYKDGPVYKSLEMEVLA